LIVDRNRASLGVVDKSWFAKQAKGPWMPDGGGKLREASVTGYGLFVGMWKKDVRRHSRPHLLIASMTFQAQTFKQLPSSFVTHPTQNSNS